MDPDRLIFPEEEYHFHAADFLGPYLWMPYVEPRVLRPGPERVPRHRYPKWSGSRAALLEVFGRWGRAARLGFRRAAGVKPADVSQLAAVPKTAEEDRQILDERGPNGLEDKLEGPSSHLPDGSKYAELHLGPHEHLVIGTKDRRHYYHQFVVSPERAWRTPVGRPFKGWELKRLPGGDLLEDDVDYYGCYAGLGMGDHGAVEWGLEAHERLLEDCGAVRPGEWLRGHELTPGGTATAAVVIDDLAVTCKVPKAAHKGTVRRDLEIFATAEKGYRAGNCEGTPEKDMIGVHDGVMVGLEFQDMRGFVGVPRGKLLVLAALSLSRQAASQ